MVRNQGKFWPAVKILITSAICVPLLSGTWSSPAAASNLSLKLQELQKKLNAPLPSPRGKSLARSCLNFAGNWEGTCAADEDKFDNSVKIEQSDDCKLITKDNQDLSIGGASHAQDFGAGSLTMTTTFADWNDAGDELHIRGEEVTREVGRALFNRMLINDRLTFKNGFLHETVQLLLTREANGTTTVVANPSFECIYQKVPEVR